MGFSYGQDPSAFSALLAVGNTFAFPGAKELSNVHISDLIWGFKEVIGINTTTTSLSRALSALETPVLPGFQGTSTSPIFIVGSDGINATVQRALTKTGQRPVVYFTPGLLFYNHRFLFTSFIAPGRAYQMTETIVIPAGKNI